MKVDSDLTQDFAAGRITSAEMAQRQHERDQAAGRENPTRTLSAAERGAAAAAAEAVGCQAEAARLAYAAAAAWIAEHGSPAARAALALHVEAAEPRRAVAEGGDGTLAPCVLARRRRELTELARAEGMGGTVDLVVPLGTGSRHADLELRYLLRSARENLRGLRLIHVVGPRRPEWLAEHPRVVWHGWKPLKQKNHDIVAKFLYAARSPQVSPVFVAACDDWLFLCPQEPGRDWGAVHRGGVLSNDLRAGYWKRCQAATRIVLQAARKPVLFYDVHVPTVQTQAGWLQVDREVAWRQQTDHAVWSLYHNVAGVHGPVLAEDTHCGWHAGDGSARPKSLAEIESAAAGRRWMNYNDAGLTTDLQAWLAARFPAPAPWEVLRTAGTQGNTPAPRVAQAPTPTAEATPQGGNPVPLSAAGRLAAATRVLIVGSAPSAAEAKSWQRRAYCTLALNNAWRLGVHDVAMYPRDMQGLDELAAGVPAERRLPWAVWADGAGRFGTREERGDTMMLNAAYYALSFEGVREIGFVGCDLDYSGAQTHFYGQGTPDPLRLGEPALQAALERFAGIAAARGVEVVNYSTHPRTLLPFPRRAFLPRRKALCCAFNAPFVPYAAALLESMLATNPDYDLHCWTTNVPPEAVAVWPFTEPQVHLHAETRVFATPEDERCYMNSARFARYLELLEGGGVDFALCLDVDALVLKPLHQLEWWTRGEDIALPKRDDPDRRRSVRACTVAVNVNARSLAFLRGYAAKLAAGLPREWYRDQLLLVEGIEEGERTQGLRCMHLGEAAYSAFKMTPQTAVLVTSTVRKLERSTAYRERFQAATGRVAAARARLAQGETLPGTALVLPVWGADGERLAAIRRTLPRYAELRPAPRLVVAELVIGAAARSQVADVLPAGTVHLLMVGTEANRPWWQRANLMNLGAAAAVAEGCGCLIFPDADTRPLSPLWAAQVAEALAAGPGVMQPWSHMEENGEVWGAAWSWEMATRGRGGLPGGPWAMTAQWWRDCGGWDWRAVEGADDALNLCRWIAGAKLAWAVGDYARFHRLVADYAGPKAAPAALPARVLHEWHGPRGNRNYGLRHVAPELIAPRIEDAVELDSQGLTATRPTPQGAWLAAVMPRVREMATREDALRIIEACRPRGGQAQ